MKKTMKAMKNSGLWLMLVLGMLLTFLTVAMAAEGEDGANQDDESKDEIIDYVNAEEYTTGYYTGVINEKVSSSVNVRYGPGSDKYDVIKTTDGTKVKLKRGTELKIVGETKDTLMDIWYHIIVDFNGETVEGYCISDYIDKIAKVTFTPTPTPEPTETPTPTPTEIAGGEDVIVVSPTVTPTQQTQDMIDKSEGWGPWVYILILSIVVVVFVIIYTVATKIQEDRLEKEMERYSNRPAFQQLDGESEEDFAEAKQDYLDSLKFGDNDGKVVKKAVDEEEIELDFGGIFDEPVVQVTEKDIAPETEEQTFDDEAVQSSLAEEVAELGDWNADDEAFMEHLKENASEEDVKLYDRMKPDGVAADELAKSVAEAVDEVMIADAIADAEAASAAKAVNTADLLVALNQLKEQDAIFHKLYGEGEVIDNSDAEVIQVRFGRDLRFLKKEKLAKKELVVLE